MDTRPCSRRRHLNLRSMFSYSAGLRENFRSIDILPFALLDSSESFLTNFQRALGKSKYLE
jgi:hypothetical protein